MNKICKKCNIIKEVDLFPKRGNECKACVAIYMKVYRQTHAENIRELKKQWKLANIDHVKNKDRQYALNNPEKVKAYKLRWKLNNLEKDRLSKRKYTLNNPEKVKEAGTKWRINNPGLLRARDAKRRASKKNRTPKWVDKDHMWLIKEVYELAQIRTKQFGITWHVDHIIPLQGELVSGLHVIENLQVIPGIKNVKKKNKYEIDNA
jgi:hypothetical protein